MMTVAHSIVVLLIRIVVVVTPLVYTQTDTTQVDTTQVTKGVGAPVVFAGDTLFFVHVRLGPFLPEDRARAITDRMQTLLKDPFARIDSLTVVDGPTTTDILIDDVVVMAVTDGDAEVMGRTRQELAGDYARKISAVLKEESTNRSLKHLLLGGFFTLLVTIALLLLFKVFRKIFPKVYVTLNSWRGTRIPSLTIQTFEILPSDRISDLLIGLTKVGRIVVTVVLLYLYLLLVFSFFPWTRGLTTTLFDYVMSPLTTIWQAIVSYIPNVFFIAVIVFVTRYVITFVRLISTEVAKGTITFPGFYTEWAEPTYKIVRFLIIAFAVMAIFPYLPGNKSPAFRGISIFLGVLFSLGSMGAIGNIVSGVILTYTRAFQVGDRVKIADTIGDIVEKNLLVTRVRTIKNVDITIPNAMVLGSHIINFSSSVQEHGLILHTTVTIGYDAPWRKVHELLIAAALSTQHIMEKPAPFVLQTSLDDFYVSYELNAYTDKPNLMARIYSELYQNIQDKFNEAGVEIMSPHYSALRDGNQTTIPEDYLPKTYVPPAFRLSPLENLFNRQDQRSSP